MNKIIIALILSLVSTNAFAWGSNGTAQRLTSPLPVSHGGTGQPNALFSPSTYKLATDPDDTASLQAAINAAVAAVCGKVVLDNQIYQISAALAVGGCVTIKGSGAGFVYSSAGNASSSNPYAYPYLTGTVIVQNTAGTDVFDITASGVPVNLSDFGITFGESIIFSNTGHGINSTPPVLSSALDSGLRNIDWNNLFVFGHDGNHYAYLLTNPYFNTLRNLWATGGGGIEFVNYTTGSQAGNTVVDHAMFDLVVQGTANCITFSNNQSASSGSISNFYVLNRPQCTKRALGSINGHSISAPTASQTAISGNVSGLQIIAPDFEPQSSIKMNNPTSSTRGSWTYGLGFAGLGVSLNDSNFGLAVQPYEAGIDGTYGQRRHYTDLSTRLTTLESAGSNFPILQDSALQGPVYATDGTRVMESPSGGLRFPAGPSGLRGTSGTVSQIVGSTFFDSTLNELVTYNGTTWYNQAGSAVTAPSSGAVAANDTFARTGNLNRSYSSGGQQWVEYVGNGSLSLATNGTYAYYSGAANWNGSNLAWIFTNNYNGTVSVTFNKVGNQPQLIFRLSDRNNMWAMTQTGVKKTVNGVVSNPASGSCTYTALTNGAVATAVLSGSTITIKNGSTTLCTITDSFNSTATGYGIGVYGDGSSGSNFTNFSVTIP